MFIQIQNTELKNGQKISIGRTVTTVLSISLSKFSFQHEDSDRRQHVKEVCTM